MLKPEDIPDEVVQEFCNQVYDTEVDDPDWARKIIAATLNKWPGFLSINGTSGKGTNLPMIILPLKDSSRA